MCAILELTSCSENPMGKAVPELQTDEYRVAPSLEVPSTIMSEMSNKRDHFKTSDLMEKLREI